MTQQLSLFRLTTLLLISFAVVAALAAPRALAAERPNILFAIADDWGWPHAGAYGDPVVKTPTFDRLAREGVLFNHAYISSPSCTPSRGAILTGQYHWRLDAGAQLWCVFPDRIATYPEVFAKAGYIVGVTGKGWGPGRTETAKRPIAGTPYKSFDDFLKQRAGDKVSRGAPFCFWLGSGDPHRPYVKDSGEKSGMDLSKIKLAACFPDSPVVRGDVADYYFEVQRFDRLVGDAVKSLEEAGELDDTIIVMTGDHGMPFPRGKSNLYDTGSRVPLAIRWGAKAKGGRVVDDFVSLTDLAPTYFEATGVKPLADMTGRSLMNVLTSDKAGRVDPARDHVVFGKERHVPAQEAPDMGGYPSRAIRTHDFLYIRNYTPDRWPNGTPNFEKAAIRGVWYGDTDNGLTKTYMIENKDKDAVHRRMYDLSFAKRPAEELYDLRKDPDQLVNVADDPEYAKARRSLADHLTHILKETADPREVGGAEKWDAYPYLGHGPRHPSTEK